jgi:phage baseplate assembly protein W
MRKKPVFVSSEDEFRFEALSKPTQVKLMKQVKRALHVYDLRKRIASEIFIGIIGVQNSGRLLKSLIVY